MRRLIAGLALISATIAVVMAAGCGKLTGTLKPNTPPSTRIFVQGPLDTVNHVVHVYWFGSVTDGRIVGFELRLLNPADTAAADSAWRFTTRTDSVFTVLTPLGYTAPTLEVRAIDNHGLKDPHPARQLFQFNNKPPVVRLVSKPGATDSTFASVTVGYTLDDPDGDAAKVRYRLWLDGAAPDSFEVTPSLTFTMPSHRFLQAGQYQSGYRWLYVQGIDDGGMAGPVDSVRWFVKRPTPGARARLLIVDDVPRTNPANFTIDTLYTNSAARNLAAGDYTVLRLDYGNPFKSVLDVAQTCKQFDAVIWYRANELTISTTLQSYQDGIGQYLDAGGRFYIDGLYLFSGNNAAGAFNPEFANRYLDCDGFVQGFVNTSTFGDSSIGWGNPNGSTYRSTMFADSVRQQQLSVRTGEAGGFRVFNVRQASEVALEAAPGSLTPNNPTPLPVGLSVPQPSGGRAVFLTVPLGTSIPRNQSANARLLGKIFGQLGLTGP
jgi:hypothetical protein